MSKKAEKKQFYHPQRVSRCWHFFPHSKWVGKKKKDKNLEILKVAKFKLILIWSTLFQQLANFPSVSWTFYTFHCNLHQKQRVISNTNQNTNTVGKFICTVSSQPSPKFYHTFPKKEDLLKPTLSWECIQLQHSGILVKNSQSAQMPTKETPSYFNQIKWILIYNAIQLVFHVNSILKQLQCSTTDSHRLAKWLHCVLINTNADIVPLGIK